MFEQIIRLYAPFCCLGCGAEEDSLVCKNCAQTLPNVPSRCYRCRAVTRDFVTCGSCKHVSPITAVYVAQPYDGIARMLLRAVKYDRARSGVESMVAIAAPLLRNIPDSALLVPVPTATGRVRQRGYDQSQVFAAMLSRHSGIPTAQLLARLGQAHQVGSSRAERLRHLDGAFRTVQVDRVRGAHIVLVDDVLTTGATLETAAKALRKAGAKRVDAVVFAQAG